MSQDKSNDLIFYTFIALVAIGVFFYIGSAIFLGLFDMDYNKAMPWSAYQYWQKYPGNELVIKNLAISHAISAGLIGLIGFVFIVPKKQKLYGDARFAKPSEVKKADLLNETGIIYGKFKGKYMLANPEKHPHAILSAKTGAGKGVDTVIPNSLNWPDSLVVADLKQECYKLTSGYRASKGQKVYLFAPSSADNKSHRYNPLAYISSDKNQRIDDIQKISDFMFPTSAKEDDFFSPSAKSLLTGIILMLLDVNEWPVTLGEVYRQLNPASDIAEYYGQLLEEHEEKLDPICVGELSNFINRADKERSGVMNTLRAKLRLWQNPVIDAVTSENDFDLRNIRKEKMTIYLGINQGDIKRLSTLINMFMQQLIDLNSRNEINEDGNKYRVLMINDEMPQYGRLNTMVDGVAFLRSFGIHLFNIIQSSSQLNSVYGQEDATTLYENSSRIVFAPNNNKDAEDISKTLGDMTVKHKTKSKGSDGKLSFNYSEQKRALMLPQELRELLPTKKILLLNNVKPIMADQIKYYEDSSFSERYYNIRNPEKNKGAPPVEIPTIEPVQYEARGKMFDMPIALNSVESPSNDSDTELTDEEVENFANDFFSALGS